MNTPKQDTPRGARVLDIPVIKMLESYQLDYSNIITDDNGMVLNLISPSEWMFKRLRRLYEFEGAVYLAPSDAEYSQCDTHK